MITEAPTLHDGATFRNDGTRNSSISLVEEARRALDPFKALPVDVYREGWGIIVAEIPSGSRIAIPLRHGELRTAPTSVYEITGRLGIYDRFKGEAEVVVDLAESDWALNLRSTGIGAGITFHDSGIVSVTGFDGHQSFSADTAQSHRGEVAEEIAALYCLPTLRVGKRTYPHPFVAQRMAELAEWTSRLLRFRQDPDANRGLLEPR